ncbi:MAG: VanW family protein [Christensenellales bacterium]|jgi:vancomycin resistance protein YoaR
MTIMDRRRRLRMLWALLLALIGAASLAGLWSLQHNTFSPQDWDNLMATGTYHEGITIDGIPVGGMTLAQARAAVRANMDRRLDAVRITLTYGDKAYILTRDDFDIRTNIDTVLKDALRLAREGSRTRLEKEIADIAATGRAFVTDYTVNPEPVKPRLSAIAAELNRPPQDATIQLNKDDRKNRFTFTDEVNGIEVDEQALYAELEKQIRLHRYGAVEIPVREVPAAVTRAALEDSTAQRITASTSFASSPYNRASRVANIKKAVGIINGYLLPPGAEFSANTVLGPRTYERGWQPAPAIVRGGSEDQAGGGVCQVSTTLYNAVLKANLEVVERRAHSIKLGYVEGGLDATINTGTIDFIFRNNTGANIYIFCWVDNAEMRVHFEIYRCSFSEAYDEIRLSSEKVETIYPSGDMLVTVDTDKPKGYRKVVQKRRNGTVYKTYRHFFKDGREVGTPELIATTKYKAYSGEIIIGAAAPKRPEPTPKPAGPAASEPAKNET